MVPLPFAIGLSLCDYLILEAGTGKVSLIGNLIEMQAPSLPFAAPRFFAHAALTEGSGDGTVEIVATRLETNDQVYAQSKPLRFPDRLSIIDVVFVIQQCRFPNAGWYEFVLLVDDEEVCRRRLLITTNTEES